jgi:hypothetical protein
MAGEERSLLHDGVVESGVHDIGWTRLEHGDQLERVLDVAGANRISSGVDEVGGEDAVVAGGAAIC